VLGEKTRAEERLQTIQLIWLFSLGIAYRSDWFLILHVGNDGAANIECVG
jgi:hypothetical protein